MSEAQTPAQRVRHAYLRWAETRGESADLFLDLMADDVRCTSALSPDEDHPLAAERVGKEFARDYLESLPLNLDMISYTTEEVVDGGDTVVWIGHCSWRERASGKETSTRKVDVWRFRDGSAVSVLEMFDTLGFARLNRMI